MADQRTNDQLHVLDVDEVASAIEDLFKSRNHVSKCRGWYCRLISQTSVFISTKFISWKNSQGYEIKRLLEKLRHKALLCAVTNLPEKPSLLRYFDAGIANGGTQLFILATREMIETSEQAFNPEAALLGDIVDADGLPFDLKEALDALRSFKRVGSESRPFGRTKSVAFITRPEMEELAELVDVAICLGGSAPLNKREQDFWFDAGVVMDVLKAAVGEETSEGRWHFR
ncbi:MAG: hypothetical protein EOR16_31840 [Mesorhizobium sp.]|uniref:hypothetical protein n=1 Tax=Mesorhizobium sp. TaxID=1871066 RepID=UPI000FE786A7|nr:hypothetical protein [Mesorhizobium sp.]RWI49105.1 MAG: hypothetical protein EOR16_31840 [Mesorhizobium sp.]